MFKKGRLVRQVLTLALIAIPWFFRDQFATSLDEQAREAQQVLSEKSDHEQRQQQQSDTRVLMTMLARIDLQQRKSESTQEEIDTEEARLWSQEAADDGWFLENDVEVFNSLLPHVSVEDDSKTAHMKQIAAHAEAVAKKLKAIQPEGEEAGQIVKLQEEYEQTEIELRQAWQELEQAAQKDEQEASGAASTSRAVAWICTAIGALMVGDWKKLLAGFTGGGDQADSETPVSRA